jgi:hypothetical protein
MVPYCLLPYRLLNRNVEALICVCFITYGRLNVKNDDLYIRSVEPCPEAGLLSKEYANMLLRNLISYAVSNENKTFVACIETPYVGTYNFNIRAACSFPAPWSKKPVSCSSVCLVFS